MVAAAWACSWASRRARSSVHRWPMSSASCCSGLRLRSSSVTCSLSSRLSMPRGRPRRPFIQRTEPGLPRGARRSCWGFLRTALKSKELEDMAGRWVATRGVRHSHIGHCRARLRACQKGPVKRGPAGGGPPVQELARTSSIVVTPASTFSMPSWRSVRMPSPTAWRCSSSARWPVWIR